MLTRSIALAALLCSCARATTVIHREKPVLPSPYQRLIVDRNAVAPDFTKVPVKEAPAKIDVLYRVRPDRRFVNAAADIVEINSGRKINAVDIDFVNGAWSVNVDGAKAITLPDVATFAEALSILTRWASEQPAKRNPTAELALQDVDTDIARFYPRFLFSAFRELDGGAPLDAKALARAAKAASLLSLQTNDAFDLADPLRGRAVALLATAKSLDATCCPDSEAVLAQILGYQSEAAQLAAGLPQGFARSFVTGEDVDPSRGAADAWLLLMRRLGREEIVPTGEAGKAFVGTIDTEAAPSLLENMRFGNTWSLGIVVQSLILQTMNGNASSTFTFDENGQWNQKLVMSTPPELLQHFDDRLQPFATARATRLLDARSVLSFYDANWYSALHQEFSRLYRHLGDLPGMTHFVSSLQPRTVTGQNVVAWMSNLVDGKYGRLTAVRVAPALTSTALLGGKMRYELFEAIIDSLGTVAAEIHRAARDIFRGLDGRPTETMVAGQLADVPVGHLARRDEYVMSALNRAPRQFEGDRSRYLQLIGDRGALRKLAGDRNASTEERITALCFISTFTEEDLHSEFEEVLAKSGYDISNLSCYWDYLNRREQSALKERFARKVLANRPDLDAISTAYVVSALGNALEAQGRYAEAWQRVEPHVDVYSANILATAVSILQRLGRNDEAVNLGKKMIERYPDAESRADFAAVLWRMRRYDDAAELFNPVAHAYSIQIARTTLPEKVVQTFSDSEIPQALAAYEALIKAEVSPSLLSSLDGAAFRHQRWRLAFALTDRYLKIPTSGADRSVQLKSYASAYEELKQISGADAAAAWVLSNIPKDVDLDLLIAFFTEDRFELIALLVAARPPQVSRLETASILAASLALQNVPLADQRWSTVRALLPETVAKEDRTILLSVRHLLHEVDAGQVAESATTPTNASEALFFLGVSAIGEGDFDRALNDFLAAGEGPAGYPTTSWAISRLYMWRAKQRPWREIVRERIL